MANARRGLYIRVGYSVFRDGVPEDLASVTALTVIFRHICQPNSSVMYTAEKLSTYANTVSATITDADQVKLMSGDYKIEVYYRRANPANESGYEPYVIDAPVFTLTDTSTEVNATTCGDITIQTINLAGEVSFCSEELEALILESKQAITDAEAATQAANDAAAAAMNIVNSKIDLDGLNSNIRQLKFNTATPVAPTQAGQMAWSDEEGTLALHNGLHTHPIGRETFFKAKNNSGALIANGKAVYAIGSTGANATIGLATTANGDIAQRTIGIATMDIASNGFGDITTFGEVNDINTSALTEGALVYLGLNGNLTSVEPVAPTPKISLGLCIRSHLTQGRIAVYVRPIARLNKLTDVYAPNLLDGDVLRWSGTALRYEVYNLVNKADLVGGKVPASQLPAYVDDILEYANLAAFPAVGETGKLYVTLDTNLTYRWSGSAYTEVSKSLSLGETSATAFRGDWGKTAYDHSQLTNSNPHGTTAAQIANTPAGTVVSTTVQGAINELASDIVQVETDLNVTTGKLTELEEAVDNTTYKHNNLVNLNDIISGEWISPTWGTTIQDNNSYHTNKIPVKAGQVLWFTEGISIVCYNNGIQYKGSPSSEAAPSTLNPWTVPDGVTEIVVNGTYNSEHIINKIYISVGGEKAVQEEYGYFTKTSDGIVENGELPVKSSDVYANGGGTFNSGEKVRKLTIESSVSQKDNTNKIPNSNAVNIGLNNIAPYFICETAGDVAAKVVDAPGFVLRNGGSIKIKMNNVNTVNGVTININNTGAKPLYYRGIRLFNGISWIANEIIEVMYNGIEYHARPFTKGFETIEDFDISAYNAEDGVLAKYGTLDDALAAVPELYKKGGMSIKYLPTEGNYYVRYRLNYKYWNSNTNNWYGIEDVPTENSKGIITSGGVFNALKPINVNIESIKGWSKTVTKTFVNSNAQLYIKDIRIPANTPFKVKASSSDAVWTQLYIFGNSLTIYGEWDTTVDNGIEKEIIVPVEVTTISLFPRYYTSLGDITLEVTYDGYIKNITDNLQKQIDEIDLSSIQSQIDTLNTKIDAEVENPELLFSENDSVGRALRTISKDSETHYIPNKFEESITLSKKAYEGLIQSMRSYEIPEVMEIELGEPEVAISTQDEDVSIYDDLDFDYSKVLKISENMYYMYYHAWGSGTTVPYAIDNTKLAYTTLFANSTDGINWTRGFPEGVTPPYETYPHSVKFLNERGTGTYEPATNVFMVHDSEYPFRCITSEGSSKIYKSRDGFTFEQPKLIEDNQVRDTQPGVVLRGDVCKIYGRGWTGGYPITHPESGYGSRNIIVFYADYNGNLVCQETPVVEGKYYNNAAFAIDDHREIIIPTFFENDNIPIRFDAYIIDGRRITQVNIDSDKMLANGTYKWGTVAPCIIATGGKTYIYYNVVTVSHNQSATSASRVCNMMRVEIKFKSNSLKYKI